MDLDLVPFNLTPHSLSQPVNNFFRNEFLIELFYKPFFNVLRNPFVVLYSID